MYMEIKVPDIGTEEVEIIAIQVKVGDRVKSEQVLITVEGNKASMEVPSPQEGVIKEIKVAVGEKTKTGKLIMIFEEEKEVIPVAPDNLLGKNVGMEKDKELVKESAFYAHASPVIRRIAHALDIKLYKIKGTGRKGRILREDIHDYMQTYILKNGSYNGIRSIHNRLSDRKISLSTFGEIEEINISRIQKISGAHLTRNWITIPHVTNFDKTDITDLEAFRKKYNKDAAQCNINLTLVPVVFIMKAVAMALEKMPIFNSSISEKHNNLIMKKYINIGVAVDTYRGLLVPVFKEVNKKGITELSRELSTIFPKAREGKLTACEMQGGCFTISSLGSIGTNYFTPIINAPEVAILGVSQNYIEPVWNGKGFIPRIMMPLSLSFDHRVIDGADGARFLTIINNILSDFLRIFL